LVGHKQLKGCRKMVRICKPLGMERQVLLGSSALEARRCKRSVRCSSDDVNFSIRLVLLVVTYWWLWGYERRISWQYQKLSSQHTLFDFRARIYWHSLGSLLHPNWICFSISLSNLILSINTTRGSQYPINKYTIQIYARSQFSQNIGRIWDLLFSKSRTTPHTAPHRWRF
jgi:hypothetical protein